MFTESFINSFWKACQPHYGQGTLLARPGNQCGLTSSPQGSLLFTTGDTPLPIDTLFTLNSTSRQLNVLSVQKAGRWVWAIVP